ncbi:MAG: zinc dependent phospholipase C family protein [Oscillospiraceae bacterium]|nr:zinc dependent phospholipase C family protein [Oscillospiraceae bacterium]
MASWMIHLRIADDLLMRLHRIDETAFVMGNIAPDSGVPNSEWSEFHPPKTVTHFYKETKSGRVIDVDSFCRSYFSEDLISTYSLREYSFFLGYYLHLLTDVRWTETILSGLKKDYPKAYAESKNKLIETAKEDWYDLDFLYLEKHPDFHAFSVYENAIGFDNVFMDIFSRDAFDNRRQYICGFYRSGEHGDLYREYKYFTWDQSDAFVKDTSKLLLEQASFALKE